MAQELQFQFTDTQAGDRAQAAQEQARLNPPSLAEAAKAAWNLESVTQSVVDRFYGPQYRADPSFRMDATWLAEQQKQRGIPAEFLPQLSRATSEAHATAMLDGIQRELADEQKLAQYGAWGGAGLRIGASLVDPVQAVANVAIGAPGMFAKGSRLARMLKSGLVAGGANMSIEAYLGANQYTRDPHDIFTAGLVGMALGGGLAGLSAGENAALKKAAGDAYTATTLRKVEQEGLALTPEGQRAVALADAPYSGEFVGKQLRLAQERPAIARGQTIEGEATRVDEAKALPGPDNAEAPTPVAQPGEPPRLGFADEPPRASDVPQEPVLDGSPAPEAPAVEPPKAPEATTFKLGDKVEWTNGKGETESGTVRDLNAQFGTVLVEDKNGRIRSFKSDKVEGTGEFGGFGAGSIGAAQVKGFIEDAYEPWIPKVKLGKWTIPLRFDWYARFAQHENPIVKQFGNLLLADGVGSRNGAAAGFNASEYALMDQQLYRGRFYTKAWDGYEAYGKRMGFNWVEDITRKDEFFRDVTAAVRGDAQVAARNPEAAKVASELSGLHQEILAKMKLYGVEGAEDVIPDPKYMMRRFNYDGIAQLVSQHGNQVERMIARALRSANATMEVDKADRLARAYVDKIHELRYHAINNRMDVSDKDLLALREAMLKDAKLDKEDIDGLIDFMFGQRNLQRGEGDAARVKSRLQLDETFAHTYRDANGVEQTIRMSDLFENDARTLFDVYVKQTTGLIGLAKVGLRSQADIDHLKTQAVEWAKAHPLAKEDLKKTLGEIDDIVNYITGRPMSTESHGPLSRASRVLRDVNFARMMGQVGFAQIADATNLIGMAYFRSAVSQMPSLSEIVRLARGKQLDDQLTRDLVNVFGAGTEVLSHHPLMRDIHELDLHGNLTRAEQGARHAAHAVAWASGLQSINNVLKNVAGKAFLQRFFDIAEGRIKTTDALVKRMASVGIDPDELEGFLATLKKYTEAEGDTRRVTSIAWDKWAKDSPRTYDQFRMAMFREVRRAVQEHSIGETAPWMHSTLGKVLSQFRTFSLVAWNKQTLYGINHWSPEVAMAWGLSLIGGGVSYVAQTALNYSHNPSEMEKRLDPQVVLMSAINRAGFSSLIPMVVGTIGSGAFNNDPFRYGRTSGSASGAITGNPTYDLVFNKILNTTSSAAQSLLTSDHQWTQHDVRNAFGMVVPNLVGARNFVDAISSDFPKTNPLRHNAPQ